MRKRCSKKWVLVVLLNVPFLLGVNNVFAEEVQKESFSNDNLEVISKDNTIAEKSALEVSNWLPDPTLQQIVARELYIDVSELTKEKMSLLNTLYIYPADAAITELTGLEYATSLSSFYMKGTNQISDFSVLANLPQLVYVYLDSSNVTDSNVPDFGTNITRLDLTSANVTDAVFSKIVKMTGLESLSFESNMNITTIAPLAVLPNLLELRIQTCGVSDFTVINNFPSLISLSAYGQNTCRNDEPTIISSKELSYDAENQSFYIPFSIMPNRMVNFDGYVPPFTLSNSASQTYLDLNGVQVESTRLDIASDGITVLNVTQDEFDAIQTIEYNARIDNPAGTYNAPNGFTFYSISSGTYLHEFVITHQVQGADVTVKYQDENGENIADDVVLSGNIGETYTSEQKEVAGYTFKEVKGEGSGIFSDAAQTVTYIYVKDPEKAADVAIKSQNVTVKYQDETGESIAEDVVLSGKEGGIYACEQKEIAGYTFKEVKGEATGNFTDKKQTVIYVYSKNTAPILGENNDLSNNTEKKNEKTKINNQNKTTHSSNDGAELLEIVEGSSTKKLPKTGENNHFSTILNLLGSLILACVGGFGLYYRTKKNKHKIN